MLCSKNSLQQFLRLLDSAHLMFEKSKAAEPMHMAPAHSTGQHRTAQCITPHHSIAQHTSAQHRPAHQTTALAVLPHLHQPGLVGAT
jgi:hypothetical protein